jgi:isopentenyl phosphate kinase
MLTFLKLGGSLITDKHTPRTPRPGVLARLMAEMAEARAARPDLQIVLGHGSGSYGHVEAKKYGTRAGVRTPEGWRGFAEVQHAAGLLNHLVADAAHAAGLPIVNFPPSASARCHNGVIETMALDPIRAALGHDLIPLVFGDVALDDIRGGTIVSTEDVFRYLAVHLKPERILLAGSDAGVLTHWPDGDVIPEITSAEALSGLTGSHAADVTGGMAGKVREMLALARDLPGVEIRIFSGEAVGLVRAALTGEATPGTLIRAKLD